MTFIFKVGNYGVYAFTNEYDPNRDTLHNWGYKIWWKNPIPRIEETWRLTNWGEHGGFTWQLYKNGKKFDGFSIQGPLIQFRT